MRTLAFLTILFFSAFLHSIPAQAEGFGTKGYSEITPPDGGPQEIAVGIKVDQITFVDQQAENYGAVITLVMRMENPLLAFDEAEMGSDIMSLTIDEFREYARDRKFNIPIFLLHNQQGRRFVQQSTIILRPNGQFTFVERFSATMQAPHFNFRRYPFDTQTFFVEIMSVFPASHVTYVPIEELSGLGDLLGEEEWILSNPQISTRIVPGPTELDTAQIQLKFSAKRHVQYYLLRFMLPLLIILFVSWATFFLEEYRRRIDMANANLLVFVAFNFAISTSLPKLGYLTFLDSLLAGMFLITGSMVIVNIALRRLKLMDREALARKIDLYLVVWVYPLIYAGFTFWAVQFFL
ncbi:hypothetical protein [Shimia sp.]|uniref:hypothetical protein n=1 Tax=Shimia sp. TaxID=1954381 RepID=UPI003297AA00